MLQAQSELAQRPAYQSAALVLSPRGSQYNKKEWIQKVQIAPHDHALSNIRPNIACFQGKLMFDLPTLEQSASAQDCSS